MEDCGSLSSSCERGGVIKLCTPPPGSRLRGARNRTEPNPEKQVRASLRACARAHRCWGAVVWLKQRTGIFSHPPRTGGLLLRNVYEREFGFFHARSPPHLVRSRDSQMIKHACFGEDSAFLLRVSTCRCPSHCIFRSLAP